jgi:hypothetical protein
MMAIAAIASTIPGPDSWTLSLAKNAPAMTPKKYSKPTTAATKPGTQPKTTPETKYKANNPK